MEKIELLIQEYFKMEDGEKIDNYLEEIIIENIDIKIILKRKVLKHIIEQRKKNDYSEEQLIRLFKDTEYIILEKRYILIKDEKENHYLLLEIIKEENNSKDSGNGVVLVLEIILERDNNYYIKTGFYRSYSKIKKLLK